MLSESEAEHARLTVLGANVRVKEGRNWVSGDRGGRRIRRQRGRQQSRLNLHILCPQLVYEEYNKQWLTPPSGKWHKQRGMCETRRRRREVSSRKKGKKGGGINSQLCASGHGMSSHLYQTCQKLSVYLLAEWATAEKKKGKWQWVRKRKQEEGETRGEEIRRCEGNREQEEPIVGSWVVTKKLFVCGFSFYRGGFTNLNQQHTYIWRRGCILELSKWVKASR